MSTPPVHLTRTESLLSKAAEGTSQREPKVFVASALPTHNPSIERTCPGKPGHASHLKR